MLENVADSESQTNDHCSVAKAMTRAAGPENESGERITPAGRARLAEATAPAHPAAIVRLEARGAAFIRSALGGDPTTRFDPAR
jgi:hypothetical protein